MKNKNKQSKKKTKILRLEFNGEEPSLTINFSENPPKDIDPKSMKKIGDTAHIKRLKVTTTLMTSDGNHYGLFHSATDDDLRKACFELISSSRMIANEATYVLVFLYSMLARIIDIAIKHLPVVPILHLESLSTVPAPLELIMEMVGGPELFNGKKKGKKWIAKQPNILNVSVPLRAGKPSEKIEDYTHIKIKWRGKQVQCSMQYGIISKDHLHEAGFEEESLYHLLRKIQDYAPTSDSKPEELLKSLIEAQKFYYSVGQDISLFLPRLVRLDGKKQPTTFIFSGTASLSPELSDNPYITVLQGEMDESYSRLKILIQRGYAFESSKTAFHSPANLAGLTEWLTYTLSDLRARHDRILVVTYQAYAQAFWERLRDFHDVLIPYIDSEGNPQSKLPYFGGLNGSNLYLESTCVICLGLNRFEPKDYISRALALDFTESHTKELQQAFSRGSRLNQLNCVIQMQNITLARDLVQLVFRSKLRQHGDNTPIELWLLQPPNGVVGHLISYFGDCQVQEILKLPESCKAAVAAARTYKGVQTHAGKLLVWLEHWDGEPINAKSLQEQVGLTRNQYKEARKHSEVRRFFEDYIVTTGSGKNVSFRKKEKGAVEGVA